MNLKKAFKNMGKTGLENFGPRFKAFTLVEMIAGLAIAALVVTIGFYGVQLLQKQYELFAQRTDESLEYRRLQALIQKDFVQANWVLLESDSTIGCQLPYYKVVYKFMPSIVTRSVLTDLPYSDTISAKSILVMATMNGKSVTAGLVDCCQFELLPFGEQLSFKATKIYSAENLINFERKHEH